MPQEFYRFERISHSPVDLPRSITVENEFICLRFRWDDQGRFVHNEFYQWEYFQWIRYSLLDTRWSNRHQSWSSSWQRLWFARKEESSFSRWSFRLGERFPARKSAPIGGGMSGLRRTVPGWNHSWESYFRTFVLHRRTASIIAEQPSETASGMQTVHGEIHVQCFVESTQETE